MLTCQSGAATKPWPPENGQGKRAVTLLDESGCYYPIISHYSYADRCERARSAPQNAGRIRGSRPMHRTTFMMAKPPWTPQIGFHTSHKQNFSGSKTLSPVRRPPLCPSMHRSQIKLAHPGEQEEGRVTDWNTHYTGTFIQKPLIPANRLHRASLVNRTDQTEGGDMRESIHTDPPPQSFFTQYNRIHNKLGTMLGPGESREFPVRQEYNIITGQTGGPAWKEDNKRVSGDKALHNIRREYTTLVLG